jgi:hypothetical protein
MVVFILFVFSEFSIDLPCKEFCKNVSVILLFLQELGVSNSSYSLRNQHQLNPIFNNHDKQVNMSDVEKFITKLRNEWKVQKTDIS